MRGMEGYMRGINLGGWLSQFDAPTKEHFDTFITKADLRRIAGMGLDHVRVPVDYTVIETEDGTPKEEGYRYIDNCVQWCRENGLKSVAFCCISTGVFGFPQRRAAEIAVQTVMDYREKTHSSIEVIFNVWKDIDYEIYRKLLG